MESTPRKAISRRQTITGDYRIFEEFAYRVIAEARECRATDIFKLNGHVYAFDSTTIEFCLNAFKWAVYRQNQHLDTFHTFAENEWQNPDLLCYHSLLYDDHRAEEDGYREVNL